MAPNPVQVRPATKDDLIRIHEMDIESWGPQTTPITGLIWLVEHQGASPSLFLSVGEEDGKLIGFVAWKEAQMSADVRSMEILHLVIAKHYRNEGMGEGLLQSVLNDAQTRGLRGASMHIPASNAAAVNLLTKLGFQEYQRTEGYFQTQGGDGVIFVKVLNYPV